LRAWQVTYPDNTSVTSVFDPTGSLISLSGARTYPVAYTYDYAGRMKTMTTWSNFAGNQGAAVTTWNYDPKRGWLVGKAYADGNGSTYAYTPGGRLLTRSWARGVTTTYTYGFKVAGGPDQSGDLVGVSYSNDPQNTPSITYTYDRQGRQAAVVRNGVTTTLNYGAAGQLLSESYSGGVLSGLSVAGGYDPYLRRTSLAALNGSASLFQDSFGYDAASRLKTVGDGANDAAAYSYLANSPLVSQVSLTQNGATRMTTTRQYDFLNRLTSVNSTGAAPALSYACAYNSANQRAGVTTANGSYWAYGYDSLGQVTSGKKYWSDTTPVAGQQFQYGFDTIGNRQTTDAGGDQTGANLRRATYTANSLNEYTSRDVPGAVDIMGVALATNSTLSVNGQTPYKKVEYYRQQLTVANGAAPVWQAVTVSATNETTVSGSAFVARTPEGFSYDTDGNLLSDGRWAYAWDAENRLIQMTANTAAGPQQTIVFGYDWKGRRIQKQVWPNTTQTGSPTNNTIFLYDGWNLIGVLNSSFILQRSFMWGLDLSGSMQGAGGVGGLLEVNDAGNGVHFVAYDGNGNVAGLVKAADGTSSALYEYGPFGELVRATGPMAKVNPFRFSTKFQDDEIDLLYYGYRYYNASTGRWICRDPLGEAGFQLVGQPTKTTPEREAEQGDASLAELGARVPWLAGSLNEIRAQLRRDASNDIAGSPDDGSYAFVRNGPIGAFDAVGLKWVGGIPVPFFFACPNKIEGRICAGYLCKFYVRISGVPRYPKSLAICIEANIGWMTYGCVSRSFPTFKDGCNNARQCFLSFW
jgi:RHS repeat-associated protein